MPEAPTICPQCGAEIPRKGLSMCPYCVMPLPGAPPQEKGVASERLARMEQKEGHAEAMAWEPPEGPLYQRALARGRLGLGSLLLGIALAVVHGLRGHGWTDPSLFSVLGLVLCVVGLVIAARGFGSCRRKRSGKLLRRPCLVHHRRSETTEGFMGGGDVTYYFELEFEDGSIGEFAYEGRGPNDDLMVKNVTGIAYTRGVELVAFRRIKV